MNERASTGAVTLAFELVEQLYGVFIAGTERHHVLGEQSIPIRRSGCYPGSRCDEDECPKLPNSHIWLLGWLQRFETTLTLDA